MTSLSSSPSRPTGIDPVLAFTITFTIMAWAASFPAIRAGLAGFGPLELAALRFALAGIPAALFLLVTRAGLPDRADVWRFLVGGIVFIALYAILLNLGQRVVPAGAASFIINTNPIMTAALAMVILGERFSLRAWLGTALAFAGIGVIALGNGLSLDVGASVLLILGAAFCNAITTVVQKPLFSRHKPLTVAVWNIAIGGLALSPFLRGRSPRSRPRPPRRSGPSPGSPWYRASSPTAPGPSPCRGCRRRAPPISSIACRRWPWRSAMSGLAKCRLRWASSAASWRLPVW